MDATEAAAVLARARQGDSEAFRALVERHSRSVFRLAFRMTGNEQDAEDVVQESFLRAYRQLSKFDERASFGTWLYRIAANCSLDLVRSRKRRGVATAPAMAAGAGEGEPSEFDLAMMNLASSDPTPERAALSTEVRDRVTEAMNELSPTE